MKYIYGLWAGISLFSLAGHAQTVNLQPVVTTGIADPIGVYFAPGNDTTLFIIEQGGIIKLAHAGTGVVSGTPFLNVTSKVTSAGNEQGLLGLAFDPDYANNGYFYINYTRSGNGATVVSRFKRSTGNPFVADGASEDIVIQINQPFSNHNGGQLQFGSDGYLYIGMGDGGSANDPQGNGQNGNVLLAKMLRLDVAVDSGYAVPADNPFVNDANVLDEIWALGVRNPWRFSFDQKTADLWIADVGQNVWEEIDFEPANSGGGRNYGWRCYEGNVAFNTAGCQPQSAYTSPVAVYNHSGGNCSVTGGFVYRGGQYASLYGKYLFTDYCTGKFWATYPNGSGGWTTDAITTTPTLTFQLTSFGQDSHGEMYLVSRDNNRIYRLAGDLCAPADIYVAGGGSLESCTGSIELTAPYGPDNTYAWFRNDTLLTETSNVLSTTLSGIYTVQVENSSNACGNDASVEVIVSLPTPVAITAPANGFCAQGTPVNVSVNIPGGTFSGPGVSGSVFNPAGLSGAQQVVYTYTNTEGCTSHDTLTINALPQVSVVAFSNLESLCLNAQDQLIGTPPGGVYAGPGVTDSTFSAAIAGVGTHTLSYVYGVSPGCSDTATVQITVANCYLDMAEPQVLPLSVYPNPSWGWVTVKAGLPLAEIQVYDVTGRSVFHKNMATPEAQFDLSALPAGSYRLSVTAQDGQRFTHGLILHK